jgi:hypothetical protein
VFQTRGIMTIVITFTQDGEVGAVALGVAAASAGIGDQYMHTRVCTARNAARNGISWG